MENVKDPNAIRFREARERACLSHERAATRIGISQASLWDIESFDGELLIYTPGEIQRFCRVLCITPRELFGVTTKERPITAEDLASLIKDHCRTRNLGVEQFEDICGLELKLGLDDPEHFLVGGYGIEGIQHICKALGVDWERFILSLDPPPLLGQESLAERVLVMVPKYEKLLAERGGLTPFDELTFHLFHLARYWSRLIGFCRVASSNPEGGIDGDLGACVEVASLFTYDLIGKDSPAYAHWQEYWQQAQAVLHKRPVTIEVVETAFRTFNLVLADLKYDPWQKENAIVQ